MIKCNGCGIELNYLDETAIGFAYEKNKEGLCQRCYQLKNFNRVPDLNLSDVEYSEIFESILTENKLIIWVIDIFDFSASYFDYIKKNLTNQKVVIVANKVDLLPKSIKHDRLADYIKFFTKSDINVVDIMVMSAQKNLRIDDLRNCVSRHGFDTAYIVGTTNVGKSTIINKLVKSINPESKDQLTTSYYAGTTLGKVAVDIGGITFVDTPGVINSEQVGHHLSKESLNIIFPKTELRPTTFQLDSGQTLFVTGLAQIDYVSGICTSFTVYAANQINVHRTSIFNSEAIREAHLGYELLQVPNEQELYDLGEFKTVSVRVPRNSDLVINGLCFIAIKGVDKTLSIKVTIPSFMNVSVRENLI